MPVLSYKLLGADSQELELIRYQLQEIAKMQDQMIHAIGEGNQKDDIREKMGKIQEYVHKIGTIEERKKKIEERLQNIKGILRQTSK